MILKVKFFNVFFVFLSRWSIGSKKRGIIYFFRIINPKLYLHFVKEKKHLFKNNFDLIRLIACIQVLLLHHIAFFKLKDISTLDLIESGIWNFPGVNIFFIISGYLIFQSLERNDAVFFLKKRFLRLFPALIVCFILTVLLLFGFRALTIKEFLSFEFVKWTAAQLTFFQFYNPDIVRDFGFSPPNGALWTISVEIQFYLFIATLWYFFLKNRTLRTKNLILITLFVLSAAYNYFFNTYLLAEGLAYKLSFVFFLSYLYFFMAGAFFYINRDILITKLKGKALFWILCFIIATCLLNYFELRYYRYVFNGLSLAMLILLCGLVFSIAFTKVNLSQKLLKGNDVSYGIYIYQMPVLNLFFHLQKNTEPIQFLLSFAICIMMGILSWYLVEKNFLKR